jgi:hypothetical protein
MILIVSSAALAAAGVIPKAEEEAVAVNPADDEIFKLIEEHKRANAELAYALSDANLPEGQLSHSSDVEERYYSIEEEARTALLETLPSSLPGVIALLDYVEGLGTGRYTASGHSDNVFDDDLYDVISSALVSLRDHVGSLPSPTNG